ncbi:MAG: riboflavin synthase subunit alpha [Colwellia sp.]|nr:riboflavin synthase subunit alpha [Colwellia sp.]
MFTGIVQSQADVISINIVNELCRLVISGETSLVTSLSCGASIAINGVCLTVVEFSELDSGLGSELGHGKATIAFDVIDETLKVTNLGMLALHSQVNVERSLKIGDEIGGHMVSGHVHCQATLIRKKSTATNCALFFQCDKKWMKYILAKGFITLNGTSLTIGEVKDEHFSVHLIPETLARTNLGGLALQEQINVEFDQQTMTIVSTIERMNIG